MSPVAVPESEFRDNGVGADAKTEPSLKVIPPFPTARLWMEVVARVVRPVTVRPFKFACPVTVIPPRVPVFAVTLLRVLLPETTRPEKLDASAKSEPDTTRESVVVAC